MTKNDFLEYLNFLKRVFPRAPIPKDKDIIGVWYKGFENTRIEIAKEMAMMYLQEEQGGFNYSKLLQYKSKAMAGKGQVEENRPIYDCKLCSGSGFVIVENFKKEHIYQYAYRCRCRNAQYYMNYPEITEEVIKGKRLTDGVFKIIKVS